MCFQFSSYFFKNNLLVSAMVRVWVSGSSMFVCHTNQVSGTIRTNQIAVYKGEVIWQNYVLQFVFVERFQLKD